MNESGAKPPKPQNMEETYRRLTQPRPSLSPSQFSEGAFEDFQDQNGAASSEQDVMTDVIPTIRGRTGIKFHKASNTVFNNLVKFETTFQPLSTHRRCLAVTSVESLTMKRSHLPGEKRLRRPLQCRTPASTSSSNSNFGRRTSLNTTNTISQRR
ncbi:hypothetical protein LTR12_018402 [Friedmanniomyces endolithicus]|nr:hypothetical protein LTR12_018402 [Friedmanniomyces endolithicus]